ncbi:MAG: hypothetical protein WCY68_03860 [Desulfuromonadales bacterium]
MTIDRILQMLPFALLTLAVLSSYFVTRSLLIPLLRKASERSPLRWDDLLFRHRVIDRTAHLLPAVVFAFGLPLVLEPTHELFALFIRFNNVYFILIGLGVFLCLLNAAVDLYQSHPKRQHVPIGGLVQAIKLLAFLLCIVLTLSTRRSQPPLFPFRPGGSDRHSAADF